jgi:hypothetical protein
MAVPARNPGDRPLFDELGDLLGPAVEQVRQQQPPSEVLARALDRARALDAPKILPIRPRRSHSVVVLATAASLFFALGLALMGWPPRGYQAGDRDSISSPIRVAQFGHADYAGLPPVMGFPMRQDEADQGFLHIGSRWGDWEKSRLPLVENVAGHSLRVVRNPAIGETPLACATLKDSQGTSLRVFGWSAEVTIDGPRAQVILDQIVQLPSGRDVPVFLSLPLPADVSVSNIALFPGNPANKGPVIIVRKTTKTSSQTPESLPPSFAQAIQKISTDCWGTPREARVVATPANCTPTAVSLIAAANSTQQPPNQPPRAATIVEGSLGHLSGPGLFRLLVAYEQTLPIHDGQLRWHCPLPGEEVPDVTVTVHHCTGSPSDLPNSASTTKHSWVRQKRPAQLHLDFPLSDPVVQSISGVGPQEEVYLFARIRPELPKSAAFGRQAVFLLDTSANEAEGRFNANAKLIHSILTADPHIEQFNVLLFGSESRWLHPLGWLSNNAGSRERLRQYLTGLPLEGATDLANAMEQLTKTAFVTSSRNNLELFLLSDGQISRGESDVATLTARLVQQLPNRARWHCYRDKDGMENLELFSTLTRKGGGVYTRDSEAIQLAHRRSDWLIEKIRFEGDIEAKEVFTGQGRKAILANGEITLAARFPKPGSTTLLLEGTLGDKRHTVRLPLDLNGSSRLAPRAWAELASEALCQFDDGQAERLAASLGREFQLANRAAGFVLPQEPGSAPLPDRAWRQENLVAKAESVQRAHAYAVTEKQRRAWLTQQVDGLVPLAATRRDLRDLLQAIPKSEWDEPKSLISKGVPAIPGGNLTATTPPGFAGVPGRFRPKNPKDVLPYLQEAQRRVQGGNLPGAKHCLESLIDEHQGNIEIARLVGEHLIAINLAESALPILADLVERHPQEVAGRWSYARALAQSGRSLSAVVHFEIALAGKTTPSRAAIQAEFASLLRRLIGEATLSPAILQRLATRLADLPARATSAIRVGATWNLPSSDIELLLVSPRGEIARLQQQNSAPCGPLLYSAKERPKEDIEIRVRRTQLRVEQPEIRVLVEVEENGKIVRKEILLRTTQETKVGAISPN